MVTHFYKQSVSLQPSRTAGWTPAVASQRLLRTLLTLDRVGDVHPGVLDVARSFMRGAYGLVGLASACSFRLRSAAGGVLDSSLSFVEHDLAVSSSMLGSIADSA